MIKRLTICACKCFGEKGFSIYASAPSSRPPIFASYCKHYARIINQNGHYALLVDGKPFFMLGGQVHNSSAWPGMLPQIWTPIAGMHANTLEIPIYWQQVEPQEGAFDFSIVDAIIGKEARCPFGAFVVCYMEEWKH
jgi:hypothetical protein